MSWMTPARPGRRDPGPSEPGARGLWSAVTMCLPGRERARRHGALLPVPGVRRLGRPALLLLVIAEELIYPAPALLQPVQRQAEIGDRIADHVIRGVRVDLDQQRPLV